MDPEHAPASLPPEQATAIRDLWRASVDMTSLLSTLLGEAEIHARATTALLRSWSSGEEPDPTAAVAGLARVELLGAMCDRLLAQQRDAMDHLRLALIRADEPHERVARDHVLAALRREGVIGV